MSVGEKWIELMMRILNPEERLAVEKRIAEIVDELSGLPEQARRAAELNGEMAELKKKLIGIGPPKVE